jgi:cyclin D1/2/4
MSISYSACFSDLLCCEDSDVLCGEFQECSSDVESLSEIEESIAGFIEDERNYVPGSDYVERFQSQSFDSSAREEAVAWILKVQRYYCFHPLTAYLAVNYLDRFLYSRPLPAQTSGGWPMQLLSVACLSLAAKMEEPLVPSLLDIQVGGAKYMFEPITIRRMEFVVLNSLDWRLRSITPFTFIAFFACKLDSAGTYTDFLVSRATEIILSHIILGANFVEYWPSCIAAATILSAASHLPNLSLFSAEDAQGWCNGLSKEKIMRCMQEIGVDKRGIIRKAPKVVPQFRVTSRVEEESSETSSSSSSSLSSSYKRRKLNNSVWV